MNISRPRDWSASFMFVDVMKSARRFGSVDRPWQGEIPLDAHGWPTADAGVVALSEQVNVNGTYRLSFTGRATVKVVRSPAEIHNLAHDAAANRTTCDVVFDAPADQPARLLLAFTDTAGGVRDVKLLRPGYIDDTQVFTDEFLRAVEPFGCLRFMDFLATNDSTLEKWTQRPTTQEATFATRGGPYEIAIELGNRARKDVWLNIPAGADDPFVRELAGLVRSNLAPDLHCYVEWSNEVWNDRFAQHKLNLDVSRDDEPLRGPDVNPRRHAWRRTARRTVEISRMFRHVFREDFTRVRVVLAGQHANPDVLATGLKYIEENFGPPRDVLYGIAIAPYFGASDKAMLRRPDVTADELCAALLREADESADARAKASHELARRYGLRSLAYEGGIDLGQYDVAVDAKSRAQLDPRAGQAVENHLRAWFAGGGDQYVYYTLVARSTRHGYWGLTEDVRMLNTPKFQAAARVARD